MKIKVLPFLVYVFLLNEDILVMILYSLGGWDVTQQINHGHSENTETLFYVFPQSTMFSWDKILKTENYSSRKKKKGKIHSVFKGKRIMIDIHKNGGWNGGVTIILYRSTFRQIW